MHAHNKLGVSGLRQFASSPFFNALRAKGYLFIKLLLQDNKKFSMYSMIQIMPHCAPRFCDTAYHAKLYELLLFGNKNEFEYRDAMVKYCRNFGERILLLGDFARFFAKTKWTDKMIKKIIKAVKIDSSPVLESVWLTIYDESQPK
jgi:hypothetical protein